MTQNAKFPWIMCYKHFKTTKAVPKGVTKFAFLYRCMIRDNSAFGPDFSKWGIGLYFSSN